MSDGPRGVSAGPGPVAGETPIVVMVGAPGAGKGTQTVRLAERLGVPSVSTGDLFRAALRDGTAVVRLVRAVSFHDALDLTRIRCRTRPWTDFGALRRHPGGQIAFFLQIGRAHV